MILPFDASGALAPTALVADAHAAGLRVHPYTFRSDAPFLHESFGGEHGLEYALYFKLGVDGLFSDFPDHAAAARAKAADSCR